MKSLYRSTRGFSVIGVIAAAVILGAGTAGLVYFSGTIGEHRKTLSTRTQENSYRAFQHEVALAGVNPAGMAINPLANSNNGEAPLPTLNLVAGASREQAGSANVLAYAAASDVSSRNGSMGYRISLSGAAIAGPLASALLPPSFRLSGNVPESEFSPNLENLILANAGNPAGTVYRYTVDGSDPTPASPVWLPSSFLSPSALPPVVKAAAFHTDPAYSPSAVATVALSRDLALTYSRAGGGASTAFTYAEVSSGNPASGIVLSADGAPPGTQIFYTLDGSDPALSGTTQLYAGAFHVPLGMWAASVPLRAVAVTGNPSISVAPLSLVLSPQKEALPPPTFGVPSGTSTVLVPVAHVVPGVVIRYGIDAPAEGSPSTVSSGAQISVSVP